MAYNFQWLDPALDDMSQEIGYVLAEFGLKAARKAEAMIREQVNLLCDFPQMGMVYEGLFYHGNEVRVLHMRQVSVIYTFQDGMITLVAVWNNYQDPEHLQQVIANR